jgi:endogenous inhibitor of DNA gyrase (YacG/DUF329 family)
VNKERQQAGAKAGGRCPICKEPTAAAYRPFCSARCRDIDLSRWLRGVYAIPGAEQAPGEGAAKRDESDED